MPNIFFISDLHLGHTNILGFTKQDGSPLRTRPGHSGPEAFSCIEEHDQFVISSINSVVQPRDRLIIVGDCVINKKNMQQLLRINGVKTLVMGNHDPSDHSYLTPYFDKIAGALAMSEFIVTHIPVHTLQVQFRFKGNIHGHLHDGNVTLPWSKTDPRYFNVCVEKLNYTPISFEELKREFNVRDFSKV